MIHNVITMKKVRFGLVGTNFITEWVLEGARQDKRFEAQAVCSRSRDRAEMFASRHNIPLKFTSLEEMVASDQIDAVYIATPNHMHAPQSILCMKHGKHVLCEKPLASNAREAEEMIITARRYGVTLMEAMKTTLTPNFRRVMENMDRLGKVRRYFSSYCQYSSRYDKFKEGIVLNAFNPELSNGAIMDIGVYTIYPMVVLFGEPQRVMASGIRLSSGADGEGSAIFSYPEMEASVIYSKISDGSLPSEIQGEDGTVALSSINMMEQVTFRPRGTNSAGGRGVKAPIEDWTVLSDKNGYYHEIAEFIDLVLAGRPESDINSHANSLATLRVIDEIRRQTGIVFPAD